VTGSASSTNGTVSEGVIARSIGGVGSTVSAATALGYRGLYFASAISETLSLSSVKGQVSRFASWISASLGFGSSTAAVPPYVVTIMVPTIPTPTPIPLNGMRQSTVTTRGLDFSCALTPGDTIAFIVGITVRRTNGQVMTTGDLAITPAGSSTPWIAANSLGTPGLVIGWYQGAGSIGNAWYTLTISFVTTKGLSLSVDAYQTVTSTLS